MPLFEYRCEQCREVSEILVGSTSKTRPACEACGSTDLVKLLSTPAVHVKGEKGTAPGCGRDMRCCGRTEPCDRPPCAKD